MNKNVYCLGFFDSLHLGHRKIIAEGFRRAAVNNSKLYIITFDDGIYKSLNLAVKEIYLLRERQEIIKSLGANTIVLPSNYAFLQKTAEDFLKYVESFNPESIIAGSDYTFGKGALGNAEYLKTYFENSATEVVIIDLLQHNGKKISTTEIRRLLTEGRIEEANKLLDSPFFISGKVVNGHENGRKIGIPTANVDFEKEKLIPKIGVYATRTHIGGKIYSSVSNVGSHPTFNDNYVNLETHIIGFDKDIYDCDIKVEFFKYLRGVSAYNSKEDLVNQIKRDIAETKEILND